MATSEVIYKGNLRTLAKHLKSGNELITDAPTDNNGKGEAFSPTDLVATALASCMLTIMGIKAANSNIKFDIWLLPYTGPVYVYYHLFFCKLTLRY
jgi:uncharacterized OsmC-like protein